jgi:hypothetical protein
MASLHPDLLAETTVGTLSGTSATDVYTVTDEETVRLLGIMVTDSTGSVATACRVALRRSGTDYVLASTGMALPTALENLEIVCEPAIRMKRGDSIRLTGASGHTYFVTVSPVRGTGLRAQRG